MLSKGLLNYSFYKLFKNLYNNYKSSKYKESNQTILNFNTLKYKEVEQNIFKHKFPLIYNVPKIKYNYEFRK